MDIAGNFWEYNAEKTFYQMLLGGVDYLLLGVLLNNEYVINKEEYDLSEVHTKVGLFKIFIFLNNFLLGSRD